MNDRAWALADAAAARARELRIEVHTLPDGARVLDAGVTVAAGWAPAGCSPSCAWAAWATSTSCR
jgi:methenyltetrahydromethanopterin cyclohydrolase